MGFINKELVEKLKEISREKEHILPGNNTVTEDLPFDRNEMLAKGELLAIRPLTRFIQYKKHKNNNIAMIYMVNGSTTHIINDRQVVLKQGDLLLLSQSAYHEILPAETCNIVISFAILPEFFDTALRILEEENLLANYLVDFLKQDAKSVGYLYYNVADILPVQNFIENMVFSIFNEQPNKQKMNQAIMELLFLELLNYTDSIKQQEDEFYDIYLTLSVLRHIEENYKSSNLTVLAKELNQPVYLLSRLIKRNTSYTYKELLQKKRFQKAVELLGETTLSVNDIISAVGYDNTSYFHRVFREKYDMSPRQYRLLKK